MFFILRKEHAPPLSDTLTRRAKMIWTAGNLLMLVGVVLLLYVGGIYSTEAYGRYAARGDTDVPAPVAVALPDDVQGDAEPAPFIVPLPTAAPVGASVAQQPVQAGQLVSAPPTPQPAPHRSTVTRVVIPSIKVDAKVIEVGWETVTENGITSAVWQVAKYAVGQHRGSANPGEGDNIVLSGHVGGYGLVFRDLFYVRPNDEITVYSAGQQYQYVVQKRLIVNEEGVGLEQQAQNARLIAANGHEMLTLVTCWPSTGPKKFSQRIVIQATPKDAPATPASTSVTVR